MGKSSQRKGRREELALAKLLESHGRSVRVHSQWEKNDLTVDGEQCEVKFRTGAGSYSWLYQVVEEQGLRLAYCRTARKPWLEIRVKVLDDHLPREPDREVDEGEN
jgi:hypothetical protein